MKPVARSGKRLERATGFMLPLRQILKQGYARGEIVTETFEQMRERLEGSPICRMRHRSFETPELLVCRDQSDDALTCVL